MKLEQKSNANSSKTNAKGGGFKFFKFFKDLKGELKRMTWASKEEVKKSIVTIMTFCIFCVVVIGLLDFGFNELTQMFLK